MSEEDPFKRRDTRPFLGKTDRRESLRADLECRVTVAGHDDIEAVGNVGLNGCFFENLEVSDAPPEGTDVEIEVAINRKRSLKLPAKVAAPPGGRRGLFVLFNELDFDTERTLARHLDTTNPWDEHSLKPQS